MQAADVERLRKFHRVARALDVGELVCLRVGTHVVDRGKVEEVVDPTEQSGSNEGVIDAIRLLTPDYLTTILPILRDTYCAIGNLSIPRLVFESVELHILAAITVALYFAERLPSKKMPSFWRSQNPRIGSFLHPATALFLIAGSASTLAYYLQGTGWYYQQIPALSFFAFALTLELIDRFARHPITLPTWTPKAAAALSGRHSRR